VPFVYCFQSVYLAKIAGPIEHSWWYTGGLYLTLCCAYYVWDTANSQKNHFRMQHAGTYVHRPYAFPQLPWQTLKNPQFLTTKRGSKLLVSGWWAYARKIHYAADLVMSLSWGLICGYARDARRRARVRARARGGGGTPREPSRTRGALAAAARARALTRVALAPAYPCPRHPILSVSFGSWIPFMYFAFFFSHLMHRGVRDNERCAKKYGQDWVKYIERVPYQFIPYVV
jgi:hypothetical protein